MAGISVVHINTLMGRIRATAQKMTTLLLVLWSVRKERTMYSLCYILIIIVGFMGLIFRSSQQHQTEGTEYYPRYTVLTQGTEYYYPGY